MRIAYMSDCFLELSDINSIESLKSRYHELSAFFHRLINRATASAQPGVEFSGPFAKTDYLLKEYGADRHLSFIVNDARVRFRHLSSLKDLSEEEKMNYYLLDFEAVARFAALIEKGNVPGEIAASFKGRRRSETKGELTDEYLRFIVNNFDERYIYASCEKYPDTTLRIDYLTSSSAFPYSAEYLRDILFQGAQINTIRPRIDNDTVYPELIIFEPDMLIDVSAVAGCFESYATDARIALLKRISPAPSGDAINLGNFASQLLDEEIHSGDAPSDYNRSVMEFFRNNALNLAAVTPSATFHNDAKRQHRNIHNALHRHLPDAFSGFDISDLMVEPSFFSEMLGLQGRMDLLQLDLRVLAEQKSGKGEWPYDNFITPRAREQHYVQLLLYMLIIRYNYRQRYESNRRMLNPFLLYSKYERSLLSLGFAPRLVAEAVKIRNLIAALDISYSEQGVAHLAELTPDMLNTRQANKLWENYTRSQLSSLLSPIRTVEQTDRLYYLRFMRFIAKEHLLAKRGNRRKENSGFASTWQSSLEEKIDSGNIYTSLRLSPDFPEKGRIEDITLLFTEDERNTMANFRIGDVVILYSYPEGSEPDARRNMVFRASIAEITATSLRLHLRAPQSSPKAFHNRLLPSEGELLWAIEHDFVESSFTGLYRAMHSFLSAPASRRDLLMFRRPPKKDENISLNLDHGAFNTLALHAKRARDFFLIVGPPGTGKTSFGLMTSLREELADPEAQVVMLAFTNRAVDEICTKLKADGIDYIRLGTELSCSSDKEKLLSNRIAGCRSANEVRRVITGTRVIVATTTALNASPLIFKLKCFSLAIIDEASQILEPHIIGLLSATTPEGTPAIGRFIMIGDHKQLPAVVQQTQEDSRVTVPELIDIGLTDCSRSLFERLMRRYGDNPDFCHMLTSQGRMHEDIADFPNKAFYNGRLSAVPLPHQTVRLSADNGSENDLRTILRSRRVAFLNVDSTGKGMSDKVNPDEARLIAEMVHQIYLIAPESFDPDRTVGVIVPYRNQIAAIRNEIARYGIAPLTEITIDTIERFQGSQRKYIIYGFTISKTYQLDFLTNQTFTERGSVIDRKLNVAMTRAEEHLLLVGNAPLLRSDFTFARLLDYLEERKAVYGSN